MKKSIFLVGALVLSAFAAAQDPWPLERHDRWGSGLGVQGIAPTSPTPWVLYDLITNTPVSCGPSIGADGVGYYGDWVANKVYKFNVSTGLLLNTFQTLNFVNCTPALSNGQIFVSNDNSSGRFIAIDTANFNYNWFAVTGYLGGSAIVGPDGNVIAGLQSGSLVCFDANFGSVIWQATGYNTCEGTPAFTRDDSKVVMSNGSHVSAINYADGSRAWDVTLNGTVHAPGVAPNGTIVVGTETGTVYGLNPATGATLWTYNALDGFFSGPAFSPDGSTVYLTCHDYRLYALNVANGHRNWSFTADYWIVQPPTVAADGSIYFVDYLNNMFRVTPSGALGWSIQLEGQARGPITIGPDGTLFVGYTGSYSGLLALSQQTLTEPITAVSMYRGSIYSGDTTSLQAVDGNDLIMNIGPTLNRSEAPCQVTLTAQEPFAAPQSFNVAISAAVSSANISQTIKLYNNSTGNWDVIDTRPATTSQTLVTIPVASAQNYWNSSTHSVQIRVAYAQTGATLQSHWTVKMDFAQLQGVVPQFQQ